MTKGGIDPTGRSSAGASRSCPSLHAATRGLRGSHTGFRAAKEFTGSGITGVRRADAQPNRTAMAADRTDGLNRCAAGLGARSEPHLRPPEVRQIGDGRASREVDLEIHGREVGRRTAVEERVALTWKIGAVLRAVG